MVDQRDTGAQGAPAAFQPLPVSTAPPPAGAAAPGHQPQQPPSSSGLDDVPLRDLQRTSRGWGGVGRSRSSAVGRPPIPTGRVGAGAAVAGAQEPPEPALDSDEAELVEHIRDPRPSNSGASRGCGGGGGLAGGGAAAAAAGISGGGTAAQAALRMSGSVVNAMVVGLSPWRWFGSGGGPPDGLAAEPFGGGGGGPYAGLGTQADPLGAPAGGGGGEGVGAEATGEAGPSGGSHDGALQRRAHPYPYPCGHALEGHSHPGAAMEAVHAVRDVLIWRNPWRTSRVFGAGLYAAVCVRQLAKGHELLQPSTALLALCFFLLLRNVVREAAATYRRNQQRQQQGAQQGAQQGRDAEGAADEACSPSQSPRDAAAVERRQAAAQLQQHLEAVLLRAALGAARYGAALLMLGVGLLSGRRAITSALVAALLWLGMVIGELRLISQPTFWLLCYVAAFTIPAAYYRCRGAMDAGVEAALRFVVRVLVTGSRAALLMAGGVAAVLLAALPLNLVLRTSLAAAAGFSVMLWQSEVWAQGRALSGGGGGGGGAPAGQGRGQLAGDGGEGAGAGGSRPLLRGVSQSHEHGE